MCKIALINGSPKLKNSSSKVLLSELESYIEGCQLFNYAMNKPVVDNTDEILQNDMLVFAFPLYIDAVPSHLVGCLKQLEIELFNASLPKKVYAVINNGYYEGQQSEHALGLMQNWCARADVDWGQGVGIGGGGMIPSMVNEAPGEGVRKNTSFALKELAQNIMAENSGENIFTVPNMKRFWYKYKLEKGWRKYIKKRGLSHKDLSRKAL